MRKGRDYTVGLTAHTHDAKPVLVAGDKCGSCNREPEPTEQGRICPGCGYNFTTRKWSDPLERASIL